MASTVKVPAQSFVAPVFCVVTAARRCKPGVWATLESNSLGWMIRIPSDRQRADELFMCIRRKLAPSIR